MEETFGTMCKNSLVIAFRSKFSFKTPNNFAETRKKSERKGY